MKALSLVSTTVVCFALAACGDTSSDSDTAPSKPAQQESVTADSSTMEKAKEAAEKVAEALKLDASSLENFKTSLAEMKNSLSSENREDLMAALTSLVKDGDGSGGGLMDAAKSMGSGKSLTETLYEKLGDSLDGKTFEDILEMAE